MAEQNKDEVDEPRISEFIFSTSVSASFNRLDWLLLVDNAKAQNSPRWNPELEEPPIAISTVIAKATNSITKIGIEVSQLRMESITVKRIETGVYIFLVSFSSVVDLGSSITCAVYLDGSVDVPRFD